MTWLPAQAGDNAPLKIAVFRVDATPPLGSPVAYAPTRSVEDPLSARGVGHQREASPGRQTQASAAPSRSATARVSVP